MVVDDKLLVVVDESSLETSLKKGKLDPDSQYRLMRVAASCSASFAMSQAPNAFFEEAKKLSLGVAHIAGQQLVDSISF